MSQAAVPSRVDAARARVSPSPARRVWQRFTQQRLGYWSFVIFVIAFGASLAAPLWSNDKPIVVRYDGHYYFPMFRAYPETTFGGDFPTPADYLDPYVRKRLDMPGNFVVYPPNRYHYDTLNYFSNVPNPAPPSRENWLGTDAQGRDLLARLVYGFRVSVEFALILTAIGTVLGIAAGALQGFFGGRLDIVGQRLIEIWSSLPELYLLIIFASIFEPSFLLLIVLLSLFGWIGLSDYVRAEFLRNRTKDYVRAARAMGLSNWQII